MAELMVTGGAGFIGANFVRHWRKRHPDDGVTVLDLLTYAGSLSNLDGIPGIRFVQGDIGDFALVTDLLEKADTLVHFAAESHVDRSILGPDAFIQTNIVGTHVLLKAAKQVWVDEKRPHRFHHISTDEVFGSLTPDAPAFDEHSRYEPNSPYSASKAASDHLVRAYHHTYGLQVTTSNCSNNYGPLQFPEKLIPFFVINALQGKPLPIYGDGGNVRDWLHVEDHCRGIALVLEKGRPGETYNFGGGEELDNLSVANRLCDAVDRMFAIRPDLKNRFADAPAAKGLPTASLKKFVTDRLGHDRRYAMNDAKARRDLGYLPEKSFDSGLDETVAWYLDNEGWWQAGLGHQPARR